MQWRRWNLLVNKYAAQNRKETEPGLRHSPKGPGEGKSCSPGAQTLPEGRPERRTESKEPGEGPPLGQEGAPYPTPSPPPRPLHTPTQTHLFLAGPAPRSLQ